MLGSFIQSQKYSVHKTLERRFKPFLTFGSDFHQLLLTQLRGLLQEAQRDARLQGMVLAEEETYKIPVRCGGKCGVKGQARPCCSRSG